MLEKYVNAVLSAPQSLGLTAARNPAEFWERHVLDALKVLDLLPGEMHTSQLRIIDVGSGNGIPGVPIAIALPQWQVSLLDSNNKRCGFLDMFCKFNKIDNVHIIPGRAELWGHDENYWECFDLAFARALGKLSVALELSAPFAKIGGSVIIPHGESYKSELARFQKAISELDIVHSESIPYHVSPGISFVALKFLKRHPTPDRYPRKPGIPHKRPL
jgi:16S rRNA (guanine527-N7)-methyltransferase